MTRRVHGACWQVLRELCSKCDSACVNSKNLVGRTALHIASLIGLVEAADVLLNNGAKVYIYIYSPLCSVHFSFSSERIMHSSRSVFDCLSTTEVVEGR